MLFRLLLALLTTLALPAADSWRGEVVRVSDGDTLEVMRAGRAVRVRLHGVDCPELGQPFGERARQRSGQLAMRHTVTVRTVETDRYGRIVGEIILPDGQSLNLTLVAEGLAWWYRNYAPRNLKLRLAEEAARDAKRGLWADPQPTPPWLWRSSNRRQ